MKLEKIIDTFLAEIVEEHLQNYYNFNEEIQEAEKQMKELYAELEEILPQLSKEERKVFNRYDAVRNEVGSILCTYIYQVGIKDCVNLLKYFGIV